METIVQSYFRFSQSTAGIQLYQQGTNWESVTPQSPHQNQTKTCPSFWGNNVFLKGGEMVLSRKYAPLLQYFSKERRNGELFQENTHRCGALKLHFDFIWFFLRFVRSGGVYPKPAHSWFFNGIWFMLILTTFLLYGSIFLEEKYIKPLLI